MIYRRCVDTFPTPAAGQLKLFRVVGLFSRRCCSLSQVMEEMKCDKYRYESAIFDPPDGV